MSACFLGYFFFFFNDTATTEIYTLSLHDALPICRRGDPYRFDVDPELAGPEGRHGHVRTALSGRSEEHTSELQSPCNLVCRLLLEKKNPSVLVHLPDAESVHGGAVICLAQLVHNA